MTKPKRASLANFASMPSEATEGTVEAASAVGVSRPAKPSLDRLTVYLTADELRTLKLICLDSRQRLTDIGAIAIREWMERNGHSRRHDS